MVISFWKQTLQIIFSGFFQMYMRILLYINHQNFHPLYIDKWWIWMMHNLKTNTLPCRTFIIITHITRIWWYISQLFIKVTKSFESLLIPQLPCSPPDVEAMRIYLILSECPALKDSKNYISLTIPLAMAILRLDANPSKVLGMMLLILFKPYAWHVKVVTSDLVSLSQITGGLWWIVKCSPG